MIDFTRVETHLALGVSLVVFLVLIVRHEYKAHQLQSNQQQTGETVEALQQQVANLKKTIAEEDKERDKKIQQLDENVIILLARSQERAKQIELLKEDIKSLRISEKKAIKRIDSLNNDEITEFFRGLK